MGSMNAMGVVEQVREGNVGLEAALHWHLTSNHYPPLSTRLIPVAEQAIDLANTGEWDIKIEMPEGMRFKRRDTITVSEAVESMHLDTFLSLDEYGEPLEVIDEI